MYTCAIIYGTTACINGDLRLRGSDSESEGLLEVCFSQRWGTVNGDGWSASDTRVACRQLGFDSISKSCTTVQTVTITISGEQSWIEWRSGIQCPIHMDNVACYGSEDRLTDCTYHTDTSEDTHDNDIWIICGTQRTDSSGLPNNKTTESTASSGPPTNITTVATSTLSNEPSMNTTIILAIGISVVVALVIGIIAVVLLIIYRYKHKGGTIQDLDRSSITHSRR